MRRCWYYAIRSQNEICRTPRESVSYMCVGRVLVHRHAIENAAQERSNTHLRDRGRGRRP